MRYRPRPLILTVAQMRYRRSKILSLQYLTLANIPSFEDILTFIYLK